MEKVNKTDTHTHTHRNIYDFKDLYFIFFLVLNLKKEELFEKQNIYK